MPYLILQQGVCGLKTGQGETWMKAFPGLDNIPVLNVTVATNYNVSFLCNTFMELDRCYHELFGLCVQVETHLTV